MIPETMLAVGTATGDDIIGHCSPVPDVFSGVRAPVSGISPGNAIHCQVGLSNSINPDSGGTVLIAHYQIMVLCASYPLLNWDFVSGL